MRILAFIAALLIAGAAQAGEVGFQEVSVADGSDKPLTVGVWYPTEAAASSQPLGAFTQVVAPGAPVAGRALPLVVMSHGTGGWYGGQYDTALALAHAGFVVAAVTHTGDNYRDLSRVTQVAGRSQHVHRVIDYMLADWSGHASIAPGRIGVWGFSAGGFTALVASGGVPDLSQVVPHCVYAPTAFECGLLKGPAAAAYAASVPPASAFIHDPRIRAAVVAAPALGFTFGREGLKDVRIPVQLWRAEYDHVLPQPDYAEAVDRTLPRKAEYRVVPGADHYDFLAPCTPALAKAVPDICVSRPGFDRAAFHKDFNRQVVVFFLRTLR